MILIDRHTRPDQGPFQATLRIKPSSRVDLIDVRGKLREEFGQDFTHYTKSFYISDHTTAGYLDQRLAELLNHDRSGIRDYLTLFQELFPPGAGYVHDTMNLRTELSAKQRTNEPPNADSHLTFIGAGLNNSASYNLNGSEPVWFVELDGVHVGGTRHRRTTVVAYEDEEEVVHQRLQVKSSPHPLDAQNLRNPDLGFIGELQQLVVKHQVSFGRFDVSLPEEEQDAGLTVNEYETLLMNYDLREALKNPLRFVARAGKDMREALRDPRTIPTKALNFAQSDALHVLNLLLDRTRLRKSVVGRVVNRAAALPMPHFLRMKRGFSLPILDREGTGVGEIGWGTYQSPILVQWKSATGPTRSLDVRLVRLV